MKFILNFFGLCKKEELDNTKELLRLKDVETEGLLNQIDNLKKFEEIVKRYADFNYKYYDYFNVLSEGEITRFSRPYLIKQLRTIEDIVRVLEKEQLYGQILESVIDDENKIAKAVKTFNKLLEVRCHENKSHP